MHKPFDMCCSFHRYGYHCQPELIVHLIILFKRDDWSCQLQGDVLKAALLGKLLNEAVEYTAQMDLIDIVYILLAIKKGLDSAFAVKAILTSL